MNIIAELRTFPAGIQRTANHWKETLVGEFAAPVDVRVVDGIVAFFVEGSPPWNVVEEIQDHIRGRLARHPERVTFESRQRYERRARWNKHAEAMGMPARSGNDRVVDV